MLSKRLFELYRPDYMSIGGVCRYVCGGVFGMECGGGGVIERRGESLYVLAYANNFLIQIIVMIHVFLCLLQNANYVM